MARPLYHSQSDVDPQDHKFKYARTWPTRFLSRKIHRSHTSIEDQGYI
jgi:hypothetical protein